MRELPNMTFSLPLVGAVERVTITIGGELAEAIAACIETGHAPLDDGDCACGWIGAVRATEEA